MSNGKNKYSFIYQDPTFPKALEERFKRMDADTGPKMSAGHGPQSWRDKVRGLALDKFGDTGRRFAESMVGMSEEDKIMNYYQRNPDVQVGDTFSRPFSDVLKYGMSDFGLADAILTGATFGTSALPRGVGTAAAIGESALIGGDAYGEYIKGNPLAAGIMGTLVGAPPLVRYFAGRKPPPKGQMELQLKPQEEIDLKRRKFAKALGLGSMGIAALAAVPGSIFRQTGKAAAKLLPINANPVGQALSNMITVGSPNSYRTILENMPKFGGKSSRELLLDYGEDAGDVDVMLQIDGHHWGDMAYPITDIFHEAGKYDKVLTFDEFKKIAEDTPKRYPDGMPAPEFKKEGGVKLSYDIFEYEPFQKSAYNEYLRSMKFIKETPEGQDLVYEAEELMKIRREAERKFPGAVPGRPNVPDEHPLSKAHFKKDTEAYYKGLELYEGPMWEKLPIVDFNDPIVGQEISKNFPAISINDPLRKFSPSKDLPNEDTSLIFGPTEDGMQMLEKLAEKMINK